MSESFNIDSKFAIEIRNIIRDELNKAFEDIITKLTNENKRLKAEAEEYDKDYEYFERMKTNYNNTIDEQEHKIRQLEKENNEFVIELNKLTEENEKMKNLLKLHNIVIGE